ncbi:DUF3310 domain-containing protein [Streptomyces sp. NBC_00197]|uniref:DUF3310 domain-containing protein n=1 Tax=Streptomyces sp. NBC_00197 TaxID=2975676 RepID=UPI00324B91FE
MAETLNGFAVGDWVEIVNPDGRDSVILKQRVGLLGCITKISEGNLYPFLVHFNDGAETGFSADELVNQNPCSEISFHVDVVDIRSTQETINDLVGKLATVSGTPLEFIEPLADWEKEILEEGKEENATPDVVNHPSHYAEGWSNGAEVIDITENLNFNRGNAVKYIARAGKKDQDRELEDLKKAQFYINREIAKMEAGV